MQGFDVEDPNNKLISRGVLTPRSFRQWCKVCTFVLICLLVGRFVGLTASNSSSAAEKCSVLTNRMEYYSMEVGIGTPPQEFAAIVDTGISDLMIPSCLCVALGKCVAERCFSENKSETYSKFMLKGRPLAFYISYKSGGVIASVVSDVVHVLDRHMRLHGGVLIMQDTRNLSSNSSFEGVMGLGLPEAVGLPQFGELFSWWPPLFLDRTRVKRFSVCLKRNGPGALRFDSPPLVNALGIVGGSHWKLDFGGISVGDVNTRSSFCAESAFACEARIDTKATLIYGPAAHVKRLFVNLCRGWPLCIETAAAVEHTTMDVVFSLLLKSCDSWLLDELPSVFLHFTVYTGQGEVSLELPPLSLIYQTETEKGEKVCLPAFAIVDPVSDIDKPCWILGLPLFHEYKVSFDLYARPPAISFSKDPCVGCGDDYADAAATRLRSESVAISHESRRPFQIPRPVHPAFTERQVTWNDAQPSF